MKYVATFIGKTKVEIEAKDIDDATQKAFELDYSEIEKNSCQSALWHLDNVETVICGVDTKK